MRSADVVVAVAFEVIVVAVLLADIVEIGIFVVVSGAASGANFR